MNGKEGLPVGAVVIGRNEGQRLERALASVRREVGPVVYVDSGSTDGSVALARRAGWNVVELDPSRPFTAARARNEGFERLIGRSPGLRHVLFLDGDCELEPGFVAAGVRCLEDEEDVALVCGLRREREARSSLYKRLMDMELQGPTGEIASSGGDVLMRVSAFREAGGFRPDLAAGEEPELCSRLRKAGWRLLRIDRPMSRHDAGEVTFAWWWRRSMRAGRTMAEGVLLHGGKEGASSMRACLSALAHGLVLPLMTVGLVPFTQGWSVVLVPLDALSMAVRIVPRRRALGASLSDAVLYAAACFLGKIPQCLGLLSSLARLGKSRPAS